MSFFPDMTLEELQVRYTELVEFNSDMNKELNAVKARNTRLVNKLNAVRDIVSRNPTFDVNVTLKAIERVVA